MVFLLARQSLAGESRIFGGDLITTNESDFLPIIQPKQSQYLFCTTIERMDYLCDGHLCQYTKLLDKWGINGFRFE